MDRWKPWGYADGLFQGLMLGMLAASIYLAFQ